MTLAELILDYLRVLIWPVVALVAFFMLRNHIAGIVSRVTSGEVDAMGVKLRLQLKEAGVAAEAEKQSIDAGDAEHSRDLMMVEFNKFFDDVFEPFADLPGPHAAVARAYLGLLSTVGKSADMLGLSATKQEANENHGSYRVEVPRLRSAGVIDNRLMPMLETLDAGFEAAGNGRWIDSLGEALDYVKLATSAAQVIAANTIKRLREVETSNPTSTRSHGGLRTP